MDNDFTKTPPTKLGGILTHLGPGLILAGSIVGSGELIATTRTGAEAGFSFLWLIIAGCVIKVFAQIEIARHCITHSETTVTAMNRLPGPKILITVKGRKIGGHIIVLFWLFTFLVGLGQLGGIVGGVGQALAISVPITEKGRAYNAEADAFLAKQIKTTRNEPSLEEPLPIQRQAPPDAIIWSALITLITAMMLYRGSFSFIETFCVVMVGSFTFITIGNVIALQTQVAWAISLQDLKHGFAFHFPEGTKGNSPLITALAAFGIIGIGASELVAYPYWCLEKGYGKYVGKRDDSDEWLERARGWMHVLHWDAWGSMAVYTTSTVAFYLLGAATLNRMGLIPEKSEMIRTLSVMYEPVFGRFGQLILLCGAFAVLFSTFFVSNATKSRLMTDALEVLGFTKLDDIKRRKLIRFFGVFFPLLCLAIYIVYPKPSTLILFSGLLQAIFLPMMGYAAVYFRYKTIDPRLRPNLLWDIFLGISFVCFLIIGIYLTITKFNQFFPQS